MSRDEELILIKKAQRGDESAFEEIVRAQQKYVYNLALKLTSSREDALDVSQEVFLKAFLNLSSFRGESRLSVWLYRLTYNASMDFLKKNRRADVPIDDEQDKEEDKERQFPDPDPGPEELLEKMELRCEIADALCSLPYEKRQILVMRELSGLSYAEIASRLKLEEGTVKSRLSRARLALAEVLQRSGTFEHPGQSKDKKKRKGGRDDGRA